MFLKGVQLLYTDQNPLLRRGDFSGFIIVSDSANHRDDHMSVNPADAIGNIQENLGQYHGCWYLGSLRHDTDFVRYIIPYHHS